MPTRLMSFFSAILICACVQTEGVSRKREAPSESGRSWYEALPSLEKYRIYILDMPEGQRVGPKVRFAVSYEKDTELSFSISLPENTAYQPGMVETQALNGVLYYHLSLSAPGLYRTSLSARKKGAEDAAFEPVARWELRADLSAATAQKATFPAVDPPAVSPAAAVAPGRPAPAGDVKAKDYSEMLRRALEHKDAAVLRELIAATASEEYRVRISARDALSAQLFEAGGETARKLMRLIETAGITPETAQPLLWLSVEHDSIETAEWLLDRGGRVERADGDGYTLLHALGGRFRAPVADAAAWVRLLVERGADLNARDKDGRTALWYASLSDDHRSLVAALLDQGADFRVGDEEGNAPLSMAVQYSAQANAALLRAKGAPMYTRSFPAGNDSAACRAVLGANAAGLSAIPLKDFYALSARTADLVPATPLHLAAERAGREQIQRLCAMGVDWNVGDYYGRTPLAAAVAAGREETVFLLLENGADPNSPEGASAFTEAFATRPDLAVAMLGRGHVPKGKHGNRAAVASGNRALVAALDRLVSWTEEDLSTAARLGLTEIAEFLAGRLRTAPARREELLERARSAADEDVRYAAEAPRPPQRRDGEIATRRGNFIHTPTAWSPWTPWFQAEAAVLASYPAGVHVPPSYDGGTPYGLVVSMTNAKSSSPYPRDFAPTLDRRKLIWVGFDPYKSIEEPRGAITAYCLALVYDMMSHYNIDPSRVYIGGYSYGGQRTQTVLVQEPRVFSGAFFINIPYQGGAESSKEYRYAMRRLPAVIVEGDYDYNRVGAYAEYAQLRRTGYRSVAYFHEPMRGHTLVGPQLFDKIIEYLDAAPRTAP